MPLNKCKLLDFPKITDPRGNLTFIEGSDHVPFEIKRVYYLYDVPGGSVRGGHAHKDLNQMIIALSGSFDVLLDDGSKKEIYHLNSPSKGLLVTPMVWRELNNFSSGSVCLVVASEHFSEEDYYRDYSQFLKDR
ncbi:FdtA/QdtA family cupin domain-containing protein [Methylophilaceae bacterium]|nr:FdtA/QdtA family cupin domain-containing protein [Methylophilaceae bacterium]